MTENPCATTQKPMRDDAENLAGAGTDVRRCSDALGRKNLHLRKLARSGRKSSSPGRTLEGNFVHFPVWYLSLAWLRRRNTD
jgi:hypothetical protein